MLRSQGLIRSGGEAFAAAAVGGHVARAGEWGDGGLFLLLFFLVVVVLLLVIDVLRLHRQHPAGSLSCSMLAAHTARPTARCRPSHSHPNRPVAVAPHRCSATAQGRPDLLAPSRQFLLPVRRRRHPAASAAASLLQIGRPALFPAPRDDYGTTEEAAEPVADQQRREL